VSEAANPPQPQPVALKIVVPLDPGDTPVLYANHFHASGTPEDLTMHLGWYAIPPFTEAPETAEVEVPVRQLAKVTVPLSLVRGIITVLENQLTAWEKNFGQPVPVHPNPPPILEEQQAEAER
jgi:hypothetical protein